MTQAVIRPFRGPDQPAVIGVFRQFMAELAPAQLAKEFDAYVATAIREELGRIGEYYLGKPGQGFWVAESDGTIVGTVGIERHSDTQAELRRMAVAAAHRRRGIGRDLLRVAEAFSRNAGYASIVLSTSAMQAAAMRLYEVSGYRRVRQEIATQASHKTPGAGLARYHYEKSL